ncbi:MAG: hypothetical protein ACYCTL_11525 [Acidimicrobiales bacterium]
MEREAALAAVDDALAHERMGLGSAVFVLGEPGLGKTSLLTRATTSAVGFQVGWAGGIAT